MRVGELLLLSVGLSMDAFAVSIGRGLGLPKVSLKNAGLVGLYFGLFQALMPVAGYYIGSLWSDRIPQMDHWIAFALLAFLGGRMILEALRGHKEKDKQPAADLRVGTMLALAFATSVDAFAVGVSLAFLRVSILPAVSIIGVVTLALSMLGVKIGNVFGVRYKARAEVAGGLILILIGTNILLQHLGVL